LGLPAVLRRPLAALIARRRAPVARGIYAAIGGSSPLLEQTKAQAQALAARLRTLSTDELEVFVCMRYWHPMSAEVAREVALFAPDRVVLLPLYPQFSTTTTGSSLRDWARAAAACGVEAPSRAICCYATEEGFVAAVRETLREGLAAVPAGAACRVLFSAHGLPKRVVAGGDPYAWQVERTVGAVMDGIDDIEGIDRGAIDHVVCYQSKVGPLEWIGPSTGEEIVRAGRDGVAVVVVPIAFVSEHSETLVELDIEYRHEAERAGVPAYVRVPTVGTHPAFIGGLASMVLDAVGERGGCRGWIAPGRGTVRCPAACHRCACMQ
jgi:ferrochelatase